MSELIKKTRSIISLIIFVSLMLAGASSAMAQVFEPGQGTGEGGGNAPESVFGTIEEPPGVANYNQAATGGIGLINFLSVIIRLVTLVAGLYVFLNLITAGYDYISAGDSKAHQAVKDKVTMSVLGLIIIVVSYTIMALLSYILFGDPSYILSPKITGPGT